ncbi:MAG TPA: hypothetical protein PLV03_02415 [Clostridiales bacterium]|nr:hypothetical protein [Clostridiales bacterium]
MANSITKFTKYVPLLDEVYKLGSFTSVLDSDPTLARAGANANEICIPKLALTGLGDYSRNSGYVTGSATLTYQTVQYNYERGVRLNIDAMDNEETGGLLLGKMSSEFVRTKVAPEVDAFRFATYAGTASIGKVSTAAALSTGAEWLAAIRAGNTVMDNAEVPMESRYLFLTATGKGLIDDLDTTVSRAVMGGFAAVVVVPQTRFYTAIDLYDGTTDGETAGGYVKNSSAHNINFMIIEKSALIQYPKHVVDKVISPEVNQDYDGYSIYYRNYGLADVHDNKVAGIYLHDANA